MLKNRYFSGLTRNTFLLAFTSFFADISTEMLYPILPIFLTSVLFAPASIIGVVEGVAEATQNIVQGFSGYFADKIQNKKTVALFGYGLAALAKPFIGLSTFWQQVVLGRGIDRFGTGTRSAPRDALIAASVDEKNKGKAFGIEGVGDNLGAVIGPLFAVFLLYRLDVSLRSIFYLAFVPGLAAFIMILFVVETKVLKTDKIKLDFSRLPKKYWKYLLAIAIFGLGNSSNAFLILRAKNIGIPIETAILIYAGFNLAAALASFPAGSLSDKFGRRNILVLSLVIFTIVYLGFAYSKSFLVIGLLFVFYGTYQGIFRAVGKAMAVDFIPQELRASGIGLYSSAIGLSSLVASIVGGQLWVRINPAATFIYGAIFAFLGGILLFLMTSNRLSN